MDGFSILDPLSWRPECVKLHPAYTAGNTAAWLSKTGAANGTNHYLAGRLYVSKSGWLLLSVPNALVRGVFDAMNTPGAELPLAGALNVPEVKPELLNAHISVMTADEVANIGPNKINERGHMFHYALGPIKEITPKNIDGISRVWAIQVASPELAALRKSYGLSSLPNGDHQFHITVAVRRTNVMRNNNVGKFDAAAGRGELKAAADDKTTYDCCCSGTCMCPPTCICKKSGYCERSKKAKDILPGGQADNVPDKDFNPEALAEGKQHEQEHTNNGQIAKEIAKDHLQEDPAYYEKVEQIEKDAATLPASVKAAMNSVYGNQALNMLSLRQPIEYDHKKPVFENIKNQLQKVKERGDFMLQSRRNYDLWRSQLDPNYRYQLAVAHFRNQVPQPSFWDQMVERYGDGMIAALPKSWRR